MSLGICEHRKKTIWEMSKTERDCLQVKREASKVRPACPHLGLGLLDSRTMRKYGVTQGTASSYWNLSRLTHASRLERTHRNCFRTFLFIRGFSSKESFHGQKSTQLPLLHLCSGPLLYKGGFPGRWSLSWNFCSAFLDSNFHSIRLKKASMPVSPGIMWGLNGQRDFSSHHSWGVMWLNFSSSQCVSHHQ